MTMNMDLDETYKNIRSFLQAVVEDETREPLSDWRSAISDALLEIDRIVRRNAHLDDVMHARGAAYDLAGIWLSTEECEAMVVMHNNTLET